MGSHLNHRPFSEYSGHLILGPEGELWVTDRTYYICAYTILPYINWIKLVLCGVQHWDSERWYSHKTPRVNKKEFLGQTNKYKLLMTLYKVK
jgi:hypothetical protein